MAPESMGIIELIVKKKKKMFLLFIQIKVVELLKNMIDYTCVCCFSSFPCTLVMFLIYIFFFSLLGWKCRCSVSLNIVVNVCYFYYRGNKERLGVAISAYMNYSNICGGRDQALDRYAMQRFLDDKIGSLRVPSHQR